MKTCPYCAEEIQDAAVKCKHCGEFLDGARPPELPLQTIAVRPPWYYRTSWMVIVLLSIPPLALPMIWWNPRYGAGLKIVLSIVALVLTYLTVISIIAMMHAVTEAENMMRQNGLY